MSSYQEAVSGAIVGWMKLRRSGSIAPWVIKATRCSSASDPDLNHPGLGLNSDQQIDRENGGNVGAGVGRMANSECASTRLTLFAIQGGLLLDVDDVKR